MDFYAYNSNFKTGNVSWLKPNITIIGRGDFRLKFFKMDKHILRTNFDNSMNACFFKKIGENCCSECPQFDPSDWTDVCNFLEVNFENSDIANEIQQLNVELTQQYKRLTDKTRFLKFKLVDLKNNLIQDSNEIMNNYINFHNLYNWKIVNNCGNFKTVTCETNDKYYCFAMKTS